MVYDVPGRFPQDCNGPPGSVSPPLLGTDGFARAVLAFFPDMKCPWGWGSYCRPIRGSTTRLSSHGSGQGVDIYPSVPGSEEGWKVATALVDHHVDLGVQYIIFDGKQIGGTSKPWRRYPFGKWRKYGNKAAGNHADHLHVELTKHAAKILTFDDAIRVLSTDGTKPGPVVAQAAVNGQSPEGAWPKLTVTALGTVEEHNGARHHGDATDLDLVSPIVDIVSFGPNGYWLIAADGGVFGFGNAPYPSEHAEFYRTFGGRLDSPITSAEVVTSRSGAKQLVLHAAGDGGIFNVGGR